MSGATKAKIEVALAGDQRSDAAAAAILRGLLEVIRANREPSQYAEDPEFLHQLRIAVRRSRAVQRQLAGVFPPLALHGFGSEFRWLQQATGQARDLDVYVHGFESMRSLLPAGLRGDLTPLRQVLEHWRLAAHGQTARALGSRRTTEMLSDWEMLLETLVELPVEDRPRARRPIAELSGHRIHRVYTRILRMGEKLSPDSPPTAFHDLRKKDKELRYLLELFATSLHPEEVVAPMVKSLKALQEVLGRHQDREVQIPMLRGLADEVARLPRGPAAVLAMGALAERLAQDELAAREEVAVRLAALGSVAQRKLVKKTFASS
ncbi:MAG: CHAD domain-containing protein [Actinomycetota bacterium]|nr:CHAD domain-containing protein [Actinomycetota bacterium]